LQGDLARRTVEFVTDTRTDLDAVPGADLDLDLAERLMAMHGRFRRSLLAVKSDDITPTQSAVIGRLVRDGAQSTADLARAEGVRPQSMGQTVAGLVEQGLAVRDADPDDGRRAVVRLTDAGRAARDGSHATRARLIAERVSRLQSEDRTALERALAVIGELVDP
jgi:DNA-binding MarR family transcriptional regulator